MLDSGVPGLWAHSPFKTTNLGYNFEHCMGRSRNNTTHGESSFLQSICDQVQEVHKLAENDAFGRSVFHSQITQFLHESLDLRRRTPGLQIQAAEYPLTCVGDVFFQFEGRCLQINCQRQVAYWAGRLQRYSHESVIMSQRSGRCRTFCSMAVSRYCLMHSRSNMWRHLDWIASSATSLQILQTVASPASGTNLVALVLLLRTRSG